MGNDLVAPKVRRSLHVRVENYSNLPGYDNLFPTNNDVSELREKLSSLGYETSELYKNTESPKFYE